MTADPREPAVPTAAAGSGGPVRVWVPPLPGVHGQALWLAQAVLFSDLTVAQATDWLVAQHPDLSRSRAQEYVSDHLDELTALYRQHRWARWVDRRDFLDLSHRWAGLVRLQVGLGVVLLVWLYLTGSGIIDASPTAGAVVMVAAVVLWWVLRRWVMLVRSLLVVAPAVDESWIEPSIDITGLDPAEVLTALYEQAPPGDRHPLSHEALTVSAARAALQELPGGRGRLDYVRGRAIKTSFVPGKINTTTYDREHGPGRGAAIVAGLRHHTGSRTARDRAR
ncbi:hypothetical protein ACIGO9_30210 [Nocardia asteroides]|uniref:hypothetical protein n=1 Tax=Nocardia asteroides TaxID=1824 RepID=UPI0037C764B4